MRVLVIDGQGGGLGRQLVTAITALCPEVELTAVGTNSMAASAMLKAGAARAVIGSAAVTDPAVLDYAVNWKPEQIAVGIDCLNGKVRTAGWEQDSGLDYLEFARQVEAKGVKTIIFTDIATDGMLSGPSFQQLEALQKTVPCNIVASGGVATLDDVKRLRDMGLYGAIIGKAYYAGTLDLPQAVKEAGPQC